MNLMMKKLWRATEPINDKRDRARQIRDHMQDSTTEQRSFPRELEPLKKRLQKIALEPTLEKPPAILWHYTDKRGLQGILTSGTLWATCLPCLKDKQETEYPVSCCFDYLEAWAKEERGVRGRFLREMLLYSAESRELLHCLEKQAAVCLSKKTDVRSQWKKYADGGRGYAIGFRSRDLLDVLFQQTSDPNSSTNVNWLPRSMVYERREQERILSNILEAIFDCPYFPRPGSERVGNSLTALGLYSMAIAAVGFKRTKFAPEHEVRLTVANQLELSLAGTPLPAKPRSDGKRRIDYLEVNLRHPKTHLMPVAGILIGPECEVDTAKQSVESILVGCEHVDLDRSQISTTRWRDMQEMANSPGTP